jgi:hypothetical protein
MLFEDNFEKSLLPQNINKQVRFIDIQIRKFLQLRRGFWK